MKTCLLLLMLCILTHSGFAQAKVIELANPSFEDTPSSSFTPKFWRNCGFAEESPPDILPGTFTVTQPAHDGKTYLGMIVRDNNTWEAIGQKLSHPLEPGQCYQLEIYLARSEKYWGTSRTTNQSANYNTPVKLRIFGGFNYLAGKQLLAETPVISHTEWKPYLLQFEPLMKAYDHLIFEACYDEAIPNPYNGNILMDNLSDLDPVGCENRKPSEKIAATYIKRPNIKNSQIQDDFVHWSGKFISKTEFWKIVEENASIVSFDTSGNLHRSFSVSTEAEEEFLTNYPLHNILEGLQQHPNLTLIIAILEIDTELANRKKQSLMEALSEYGDLEHQIIIKRWGAGDENYLWYGAEEKYTEVMMR